MKSDSGENRRQLRLEKELREVIGSYLISGFRGELLGFLSVPRVQVSGDLRTAKVFVSMMGASPDEQKSNLAELEEFASDIQSEVHHQLRLRYTPRLSFHVDESLEKQLQVETVLRNLALERAAKGEKTSDSAGDEPADEND